MNDEKLKAQNDNLKVTSKVKNIENKEKLNPDSNTSLASKLLLPMSVVFLAVAVSCSLILSSLIISKAISEVKISTSSTSSDTSSTTPNTGSPAYLSTMSPTGTVDLAKVKALFTGTNFIKFGNENSKLLFVDITDPSCPYCHMSNYEFPEIADYYSGGSIVFASKGGTYTPVLNDLKKLVQDGKASYVFLFLSTHGNGEKAAQVLGCAYDQDKYWEVHDAFFSKEGYQVINGGIATTEKRNLDLQTDRVDTLINFVANKVDKAKLKACMDSGKYTPIITASSDKAKELGIGGTPGYIFNTNIYGTVISYANVKDFIENALK
jgi:protein-disulfide isomerase